MVNASLEEPVVSESVKEVSLDEEMFERAGLGDADRAVRRRADGVRGRQAGRARAARRRRRWSPNSPIPEFAVVLVRGTSRTVVRQMKQGTRRRDGDRVGGFEVEEPDAGVAVTNADVGSQVGLVEG